ncbi:hypothetical protein V8C44DRAFT_327650 [Trichoderma aethiopicum]
MTSVVLVSRWFCSLVSPLVVDTLVNFFSFPSGSILFLLVRQKTGFVRIALDLTSTFQVGDRLCFCWVMVDSIPSFLQVPFFRLFSCSSPFCPPCSPHRTGSIVWLIRQAASGSPRKVPSCMKG